MTYLIGGATLLILALTLTALFTTQSRPTASVSSSETPQATPHENDPFAVTFFNEAGDDSDPAWSPDGRRIAYVSQRDGRSFIFVRDMAAGSVSLIAEDAWGPKWSPDGQHLAYQRASGSEHGIYVTDPTGSSPIKVNDVANAGSPLWLPDNRSLLFLARQDTAAIHIVSLDSPSVRTVPIGGVWRFSVSDLSPDGARVVGSGLSRESSRGFGLIVIDIRTQATSLLTPDDPAANWGLWSPDGARIAYHTSDPNDSNISHLRVADANGGASHAIAHLQPGQSSGQHAWSPDSRFVAYLVYPSASVLDGGEVRVARADGSQSVSLLPRSIARTFAWSPDGSQIALSVRNGAEFDIAIVRADEAALLARQAVLHSTPQLLDVFSVRRLTHDLDQEFRPDVSPDGRTVVFAGKADDGANRDIYLLDLSTGEKRRLTNDLIEDRSPAWSPDGARLVYQHHIQLGDRLEWIVMNADGSNAFVAASGAARNNFQEPAAWSPAGDRIAFTDNISIVVVGVESRSEVGRFDPPDDGWYSRPVWLPDGRRLAFLGRGELLIGDLVTGRVEPVAAIGGAAHYPFYSPLWSDALSRLAYVEYPTEGEARLYSVDSDGSGRRLIAQVTAVDVQHPAWSPDGRFIAYYADDTMNVSIGWTDEYVDRPRLFTLGAFSSTADRSRHDTLGLSWLPDGSGFVFVASLDGQPDLYVATLDEEAIRLYLEVALSDLAPTPLSAPFPRPTPIQPLGPTPSVDERGPKPALAAKAGSIDWLRLPARFGGDRAVLEDDHIWILHPPNSGLYSADRGASWSPEWLPAST